MTIQPTHHRILIRITKSDSTIVRPDDVGPLSDDAITVVSVGPDVTCCKPDDRILLRPDARNFIGIEKSENVFTCIINDDIVIAVVTPDLTISK